MAQFSMYSASAPVFAHMLKALSGMLDKAEAYAKERNFDTAVLMGSRLAPDMLPLSFQIHIATSFMKNTACKLGGQTPPDFSDIEPSFAAARARIAQTLDIVQSAREADFANAENLSLTITPGGETMTLSGKDYLCGYALPNIYFHLTAAYAILRHNGVPLGKRDFLPSP